LDIEIFSGLRLTHTIFLIPKSQLMAVELWGLHRKRGHC
jgi:hypothetical protein